MKLKSLYALLFCIFMTGCLDGQKQSDHSILIAYMSTEYPELGSSVCYLNDFHFRFSVASFFKVRSIFVTYNRFFNFVPFILARRGFPAPVTAARRLFSNGPPDPVFSGFYR